MVVSKLCFPLIASTSRSTSFGAVKPRNLCLFSRIVTVRAIGEWREYEDAVREKDLARALRFLKTSEDLPIRPSSDVLAWPEKDWEVLDTCLNADDMKLVAMAYSLLQDRGLLDNFGKCKSIGNLVFYSMRH